MKYFSAHGLPQEPLVGWRIEQLSISIISGLCQLRCVYCPAQYLKRPSYLLDVSLFKSLLDQVKPKIVNLQGYGEPTLHPNFIEIMRLAKGAGRIVKFFSNFQGWSNELAKSVVELGIDQIIISIDTFDPVKYAIVRCGGCIDEVLKTVRLLAKIRKDLGRNNPEIIWNCVIMRDTVGEIEHTCTVIRKMGIGQPVFEMINDYGISKISFLAEPNISLVHAALLKARAIALESGWHRTLQNIDFNLESLVLSNLDYFRCFRPWRLLTVMDDGNVVPCGEFYEGQIVFGNLKNSTIDQVWQGSKARSFRSKLLHSRLNLPVCSRCTVNEKATTDLFDQ